MESSAPKAPLYRFGLFEVDANNGVLRRQGQRVKIQEQPLRLLIALLEQPGEIVSRENLRQRLWPENTFVEFDQSLGTAITKLRQALGDDSDNPRFVETVPKRGYRLLAPVTLIDSAPANAESASAVVSPAADEPAPNVSAVPRVDSASASSQRTYAQKKPLRWTVAALALTAAVIGIYFYQNRKSFALTEKDTVVLADFQNTTGEPVFDDALRQGLIVALGQSSLVQVLSDRKADLILKQMNHSPDTKVTGKAAMELCQRSGSKVVVEGSISNLGTGYLVGLAGARCDTGDPIFHEEVAAKSKEDVIGALGEVATRVRGRLGESVASIHQHDIPLAQATTSSLPALKAYSQALAVWDRQGDEVSLPYFQRAIQLDPDFAMAYAALGTIYHNLNEANLSRDNTSKAYELRDRLTDRERLSIEARYYTYVTGEQEKAAQVYLEWVKEHPNSAGAYANLAGVYANLGRFDKVAEYDRESLRVDPMRSNTYAGLASALMALNQIQEASGVLAEAEKRQFHTDYLLQANYWLAFLLKDSTAMEQLVVHAKDVPDTAPLLLFEQSNTDAYGGQFRAARSLTKDSTNLLEKSGDRETAATFWAEAALREAETGNGKECREDITKALKLSRDRGLLVLAALAYARVGDARDALPICETLDKENPASTLVQGYWLPSIRAALELQKKDWSKAIELLAPAESLEYGGSQGALTVNLMYPAFLRGEAYLGAGESAKAAEEFQKLIEHPGVVLNFPLGALAFLERGRAYVQLGNSSKARQDYQEFLSLWRNSDPDLVPLKQARTEFAKLPS